MNKRLYAGRWWYVAPVALLALTALLSSCDDDKDKSALRADFLADNREPLPNSLHLLREERRGESVLISLMAHEISNAPACGLSCELHFNEYAGDFVGFEPGDFFEMNATVQVNYALAKIDPDLDYPPDLNVNYSQKAVSIGISQVGAGPGVTGSGLVCTLEFKINGERRTPLWFRRAELLTCDAEPEAITGISWYAGLLIGYIN
jgi:hypothetical protein